MGVNSLRNQVIALISNALQKTNNPTRPVPKLIHPYSQKKLFTRPTDR
jgi:hypothetical protein